LSSAAFTPKKLHLETFPRNNIKYTNKTKECNRFENAYEKVFQVVSIGDRSNRILLTQQFTVLNRNVSMESLFCITPLRDKT